MRLLALYVDPAQVTWCNKAFAGLGDLAGRRIRVSNATQSDWVLALGAVPVQTAFAEIVDNVKSGNVDCAITDSMSGNTIGLHEVTSHVHAMAVSLRSAAKHPDARHWTAPPRHARSARCPARPRWCRSSR